jgi:hypothetical protein
MKWNSARLKNGEKTTLPYEVEKLLFFFQLTGVVQLLIYK